MVNYTIQHDAIRSAWMIARRNYGSAKFILDGMSATAEIITTKAGEFLKVIRNNTSYHITLPY